MKENTMKLGMEIKNKVELLNDVYPTERILAIRFFKNIFKKYGVEFVNRVLESFNTVSDIDTINQLYMEDGDLYEVYNGKSYMLTGENILAHVPVTPEDNELREVIEEAIYDYYL